MVQVPVLVHLGPGTSLKNRRTGLLPAPDLDFKVSDMVAEMVTC